MKIGSKEPENRQKIGLWTVSKMLRAEDSVKDRLASYFYWDDRQGLDQSIDICLECNIDIKEVKKWAVKEGFEDKFQEFLQRLRKG